MTIRTDNKNNITKIAAYALKNPEKNQMEIANAVGVSNATVSTSLKKLKNDGIFDKSADIIKIADNDLEDLKTIQEIERSSLLNHKNRVNEISIADLEAINRIGERKQRRYSLLVGKTVDARGGNKTLSELLENSRKFLTLEHTETVNCGNCGQCGDCNPTDCTCGNCDQCFYNGKHHKKN